MTSHMMSSSTCRSRRVVGGTPVGARASAAGGAGGGYLALAGGQNSGLALPPW